MAKSKKPATATKTAGFDLGKSIFRVLTLFLATIGDFTISFFQVILQGFLMTFSISKNLYTRLHTKPKISRLRFPQFKSELIAFKNNLAYQLGFLMRSPVTNALSSGVKIITQIINHRLIGRPKQVYPPPRTFKLALPQLGFPRLKFSIPRPPPFLLGLTVGALLTFFLVFIPYQLYIFIKYLPNPHLLSQRFIPVTTQIYDRNGTLLYEIHGDEDRKPIPLAQIPEKLKQATIAIEDKNFYLHPGFSLRSIIRAAHETLFNNNLQGGSTLTQQLIKNSLLTPELSITRKVREVTLAFWAERIYSKDQILEMYLNQVPYGGTAWGIEAAAEKYFGKKVADLTLAESALLAGLPAAPSLYSPYGSRPELARERQQLVLQRMVEDGYISQIDADQTINQPLTYTPDTTNIKAPHFVMYVRELLTQKFGARLVDQGGLRVTTSLDLPLQEKIQDVVTNQVNELARLHVGNGAAVVLNPKNGEVLAMVGSKNYFDSEHDGNVNVALSPRQPGSSIKVVNYAAALEKGFTAASVIEDTPISFAIPGQPSYAPVNYDGRFHGNVSLRTALASSYNVPAVKVLNRIGVANMIEMGRRMGITTWNDDSRFGLSLTLGGGEVTLLELTGVYGVLANSGKKVDSNPILGVTDFTGKTIYEKGVPQTKPTLSEDIAFILSDILADNQARSSAFGPNSALVIPGKTVSVKTGTTNDKRDNWTIGYTPSVVVGVWVGNNDNSPMDPFLTSGITGAAPIWNKIMADILKGKGDEKLSPSPNLVTKPCLGRQEYFIRGTETSIGCNPLSPSPTPAG